ncbi:PDZ domain-containing protein [Vibrio sp.]|nr:PDZ domain-containing protein [Vibrio sp.]
MNTLHYSISCEQAKQHLYSITLAIPEHQQETLQLSLPAWIPGSYMVRDFSKHIVNLKAMIDSTSISTTFIDKQTFSIKTDGRPCVVTYQIYAYDDSVRTAYLDQFRGFFNGSSVFLCVSTFEERNHQVTIETPSFASNWKVATGLSRSSMTKKYDFGTYVAANYDELIDCPVELGDFESIEFDVFGVSHHLVLAGKHYADRERLKRDLTKLCQHHIRLFNQPNDTSLPFKEYWFLTNVVPSGFGGLEHKNSTALICSTFDLPNRNNPIQVSDGYKNFLSLASHEYFHLWSVCRIKPMEFMPYQLDKELYTQQLWAYEGITSYYDDFSLYRAGIISFDEYLTLLSAMISRVSRGQGQYKQNLLDSSFFTWTKFYQQGADAVNNIVSYYTKGALVAVWLDLTIRNTTSGKYSLDDVMRRQWLRYQSEQEEYQGTEFNDIFTIVESLAGASVRQDLFDILNGTNPVPLGNVMPYFGVSMINKPSMVSTITKAYSKEEAPFVGIGFKALDLGIEVTQILEHSPAEQAGIAVKDTIIAIDRIAVSSNNYEAIINNLSLDTDYSVDFIRNGLLVTASLKVVSSPKEMVALTVSDEHKLALWQCH